MKVILNQGEMTHNEIVNYLFECLKLFSIKLLKTV